jgi:hypothetical protein
MRLDERTIGWLVLLPGMLAAGVAWGQGTLTPADRTAIKSVLDKYREAILAGNGETVIKLLDAKTVRWYEDALKDALTLKKAELAKRDYLGKLTILRLRHEMVRSELEKTNADEVIVEGVKKGWIGGSFADMIVIQNVGVSKDGLAFVTLRQNPKVPAFHFAKEDGKWKLALSYDFKLAQKGFEQLQAKSGLSADEFLIKTLEEATRRKVDRKIFDGPRE